MDKDKKKENILAAVINVIAEKGYDNTTINAISEKAKVSRGILHYYFEDKEDLVSKALQNNVDVMIKGAKGLLHEGKTPEQISSVFVDFVRNNAKSNATYYRFLYEMFCLRWQSIKIKKVLSQCHSKVFEFICDELSRLNHEKILSLRPSDIPQRSYLLMSLADGLIFHMIQDDQFDMNKKFWDQTKKMVLDIII